MKRPLKPKTTLNGWKEIANFFGRGVRTVQRWERELALPVHRVRNTEHSPVFAYGRDLEVWSSSRPALAPVDSAARTALARVHRPEIHDAAEQIVRRSQHLVEELGVLVIEQRNRAEELAHRVRATMAGIHERRKRRDISDAEPMQLNIV